VVTTNHNSLSFDQTKYQIFVVCTSSERLSIIPLVAVLLGLSSAVVRGLVDSGKPVIEGMRALEVQNMHQRFESKGIRIQIQPPFPWPLQAQAQHRVQAEGID
jgi:hypothetical protein